MRPILKVLPSAIFVSMFAFGVSAAPIKRADVVVIGGTSAGVEAVHARLVLEGE